MSEVEIVPLSDTQIEAIKSCRFVTTNAAHTVAWAWTDNERIAAACPGNATHYRRAAGIFEYEIHMAHPLAVQLIREIVESHKESSA